MTLTLKIFFAILALYALLWLPGFFIGDKYLDSVFGFVAIFPYLSVYLFHSLGIPGLLQNGGLCGWGWCAPTVFAWIFITVFWLATVYLASKGLAQLGGKP